MSRTAPIAKMNGIGNRIVVADMRGRSDVVTAQAAVALNGAVPFDQLMAIHDPATEGTDALVRILNNDGSSAGACGNGMRCLTLFMAGEQSAFTFQTQAGLLPAAIDGARISVGMGHPRFEWDAIPLSEEFADTSGIELEVGPRGAPILHTPSVANMGNPHVVFWADRPVEDYELDRFGPMIEHHPYFPEGVNVSVARVTSKVSLDLRTWERGVGLTQACGSAACAAAVSAARRGFTGRNVAVRLPGGTLDITWSDDGVTMTGAAEHEFDGTFDPATGAVMVDA